MVKLLVYGYATGTPSSRKLEERTYSDVAVRFLCADQHPDFRPIARFRRRHLAALADLFVQALRLCKQAGLVGLGTLALDGTKLRANASRHKAMSYGRMVSKEAQLEAEIKLIRANAQALLGDAERIDAEEDGRLGADRRGDELPEELQRREDRLARIREAKQALEAQARAAETARRAEMAEQGKTPRQPADGRDPFAPKPKAQRNFTDPDSKIMKTADGSLHQCFNGQAIVDSQAQVIVACELSNAAPDAQQLEPALDRLAENLAALDAQLPERAALVADAGYFSEQNITITTRHGLDPHIATGKTRHDDPRRSRREVRSLSTPRRGSECNASSRPRRATPSTSSARRSSSPSSDSSTPSKTPANCCYAPSPPRRPNGRSPAPSTIFSSSTAMVGCPRSR